MRQIGFVAVDGGPRAALAPIASTLSGVLYRVDDAASESRQYWAREFAAACPSVLFVGTSDSSHGFRVESAVRRAAGQFGIPTVLVEDFPGNYRRVPGVRDVLLVADGSFSLALARSREAGAFADAIALSGLRYDAVRGTALIRPVPINQRILWAGQPETDDALATLDRLVEVVKSLGLQIVFRAPPRDAGYWAGAYQQTLSRLGDRVIDMTTAAWQHCLSLAPSLVVTQFSSVAVELGFFGIPAVHVLYEDIGQRRLLERKGYAALPWCDAGASWAIRDHGTENVIFREALDPEYRASKLEAFSKHMLSANPQTPVLRDYLYNHRLI